MKEYTKDELLKHLYFVYKDRRNKIPSTVALRMYEGKPQYGEFVKVFGSWEKAIEEFGTKYDL